MNQLPVAGPADEGVYYARGHILASDSSSVYRRTADTFNKTQYLRREDRKRLRQFCSWRFNLPARCRQREDYLLWRPGALVRWASRALPVRPATRAILRATRKPETSTATRLRGSKMLRVWTW